jgi:hypothetical protein
MKDSIPLLVPEGWTVTRVLYALSGPPGGIIMTKDDTMVVALRGVEGKAEWWVARERIAHSTAWRSCAQP